MRTTRILEQAGGVIVDPYFTDQDINDVIRASQPADGLKHDVARHAVDAPDQLGKRQRTLPIQRMPHTPGRFADLVDAYTNESFGYLPTAAVLAEGGHESMCLTLDFGFFAPSVEDVVVQTVRELARQAGRPERSD